MIAIQTSERNGKVVAAQLVEEDDQIMLITQGGTLVRTRISEVRVVGRATQGVTLIGLDEGDVLSGVQKVMVSIDEDELDDSVDGDTPITSAETSSETPPETPTE
jgi:DNA gyrase subunit A